ncbi:MAG: C39 family peptidase [Spirochaetales bacterium]|nr:C39 family peptidase [Leptospiraceae bacterium]MCP5481273.1 C39 family peptidase [Spirochaetales bacterium]MCP5485709.1 C39 family peptidase [Spirochaetales bacterium]
MPIPIRILPQPDDVTCGPTSLHAVYRYYGIEMGLEQVIDNVSSLEDGGTLAVMLGIDAMERGLRARIYTYNLRVFDPTWANLTPAELQQKLRDQLEYRRSNKMQEASAAYDHFLDLGGEIRFDALSRSLLEGYLSRGIPILAGLNATYLYNCSREYTNSKSETIYHDLKGESVGHFVVLCGMDEEDQMLVADPYTENPISGDNYYRAPVERLIHSILLGVLTYDANLLVLEKA